MLISRLVPWLKRGRRDTLQLHARKEVQELRHSSGGNKCVRFLLSYPQNISFDEALRATLPAHLANEMNLIMVHAGSLLA